jgi:hypothetical protein
MRFVLVLLAATALHADEPARASDAPTRKIAAFVLGRARIDKTLSPSPSAATLKRLSGRVDSLYEVCVNREGRVYEVKTICAQLPEDNQRYVDWYRQMQFKPQSSNVCATFTFGVGGQAPIPETAKIEYVERKN